MTEGSDRAWLDALARGEQAAFERLYDAFATRMYRMARSLTGSPTIAEDAVQEVFVDLAKRRHTLKRVKNLQAYLFTAVRHSAWRQRKLWRCDGSEIAEPASAGDRSLDPEVSANLENALLRLPDDQRQIVVLKIDGELTFEQIGAALGISPNTAASRYRYALEKLRQWM